MGTWLLVPSWWNWFQAVKKTYQAQSKKHDPEVSFHQFRPPQAVPNMFIPYIEGPKMDWTVNEGLDHWFLNVVLEVWEYSGVWACSFAWVTPMQESDCLGQGLWHGPMCVMVLVSRRVQLRYNLGKVWGVLQATVEWGWEYALTFLQALDKAIGV